MKGMILHIMVAASLLLFSCRNEQEEKKGYEPQFGSFTGSDGREHPTVTIEGREYLTANLDVDIFLNGDPIPEAKTPDE